MTFWIEEILSHLSSKIYLKEGVGRVLGIERGSAVYVYTGGDVEVFRLILEAFVLHDVHVKEKL